MANRIVDGFIFLHIVASITHCNAELDAAKNDKHKVIFTNIFKYNAWEDTESVSGAGSSLPQTVTVRQEIPNLLKQFSIHSLLDIPCGDFNWARYLDLPECHYIGVDIVEQLIEKNISLYGSPQREFLVRNAMNDLLPKTDLILCRDMLVHFTLNEAVQALKNLKGSGSKYLLVTTHTSVTVNEDIETGNWRKLNFEKAPFNFPKPIVLVNEQCPDSREFDKCLALWAFEDLNLE